MSSRAAPLLASEGPGRAVRMPRVLCEARNRTFGAHPYGRTAPGPRLYCLAPGQRRHCGACGMSCAETLAGEAIGGYRLKTPASQIASYSSQETELAALVSRKSFCILLWPLRGDQVSSGRDGTSRLPAICCLLSIKWPVGALILLFHHCRRAFARPGRVRDPSLRGHCRFHPMLESPCETSSQIHRRD